MSSCTTIQFLEVGVNIVDFCLFNVVLNIRIYPLDLLVSVIVDAKTLYIIYYIFSRPFKRSPRFVDGKSQK